MGVITRRGFLEGVLLVGVDGEPRMLSDLWRDGTVILKVQHAPGCPVCRYEIRLLSDLKPSFDDLHVRLVGVGFEEVTLQEFLDGKYWEWELFLDPERSVPWALHLHGSPFARMLDRLGLRRRHSRLGAETCGIFVITPSHVMAYGCKATVPSRKSRFFCW